MEAKTSKLGPIQQGVLDFLKTRPEGASKYEVIQDRYIRTYGPQEREFTHFTMHDSFNTYQVLRSLERRGLVVRTQDKKWHAT